MTPLVCTLLTPTIRAHNCRYSSPISDIEPKMLSRRICCLRGTSIFRNTLSTAGNSMTGSEGPSPEPLLKKRGVPRGGDNSGNALEASNALNYRGWGIPAVLSTGIPGNALRAFPGSFRNFSGIFPEFLPESPSRTRGVA